MTNFRPDQPRGLNRAARLVAVESTPGRFAFAGLVPAVLAERFWQGWVDAVQAANHLGFHVENVYA